MDTPNTEPAKKGKPGKKILRPSVIIVAIITLIIAGGIFSTFYVVDQTEQAVITRFGKYYKTLGAGLQTKLPFGIDKKYIVPGPQAVQTEQFGFRTTKPGVVNQYVNNITTESTMLTGDLNIVDVEWIIQYRITNAKDWIFAVEDRTKTIRDISYSVINELVGDRAILDIMSAERTNIQNLAVDKMNEQFKKLKLGITVTIVQDDFLAPVA